MARIAICLITDTLTDTEMPVRIFTQIFPVFTVVAIFLLITAYFLFDYSLEMTLKKRLNLTLSTNQ